jgi:predicted transcriptional regulator
MTTRRWALLAAGLLFLVPPALAAEGTLAGRAELPLEVDGRRVASGTEARFLLEGDEGTAAFLLQGAAGEATRVIHRAWGYVNSQDPKAEILWDDATEFHPLDLSGALLSLDARRPDFRLLVYDGSPEMSPGPVGSPLLVGALDEAKSVDYTLDRALSLRLNPPKDDDAFRHVLPPGTFQARSDDGRVRADGAFRMFVTDAELTYRGARSTVESIPAHFRVETRPGALYDPVRGTWFGVGTHTEYVQEYLLVEATDAQLDLQFAGVPASLYSPRPVLDVEGTTLLPAMDGAVTVTEDGESTRHVLRGEDLALAGRYTLRLHDVLASPAGPARTHVEGDGDITAVTYAGTTAHYDWIPVAAATGIGALLLVAVAWLSANAKTLGSVGLGGALAGYARVSGEEVLEHPGRQEVYERVKAAPGINFVQLAAQVGFGSSTLNYHLRVLERNEYITSVKDGRYLRFFDRQAGTYSGAKKVQVSALRNAQTAAMARHIRDHPGIAQCDLAAAFGVTASTVNWHMTRLQSAGLVERHRDAHYTRYYLSQGWSQLPASELERLGTAAPAPVLAVAV